MNDFESLVENLNQHLNSNRQSWLFGAGISCAANIPLMYPLTDRVKAIIAEEDNDKNKEIYESLSSNIETNAHVEHYTKGICRSLMYVANQAAFCNG